MKTPNLSSWSVSAAVFCGLCSTLSAQQTNPGLLTDQAVTRTQAAAHDELTGLGRANRDATKLSEAGLPATVLEAELRNAFSSRHAKPGEKVELSLRKSVTLPDGQVLPRGTVIRGHVVQTAAHSKSYKNGAILLSFDEAAPKNSPEIPLFALIEAVAPSIEDQKQISDPIHHGTIGGTSNSPNAPILGQGGYGDAIVGQNTLVSGLPGILLTSSAGGSGILIGLNDDAAMEGSQLITLVAGVRSTTSTEQRAFMVLHPKKTTAGSSSAAASRIPAAPLVP